MPSAFYEVRRRKLCLQRTKGGKWVKRTPTPVPTLLENLNVLAWLLAGVAGYQLSWWFSGGCVAEAAAMMARAHRTPSLVLAITGLVLFLVAGALAIRKQTQEVEER